MSATLVAFGVGLVVLLVGLAWLEQRRAEQHRARVLDEVQTAKDRGSHKALSQHPQIDPLQCVGCALCVKACPENGVLDVVDGTAVVVHGSRCIGHGRCAEACPVGAIQVGLGDVRDREDIPILAEAHESSVPGVFLAGELTGIALIRNAIRHGVECIDEIARRKPWTEEMPGVVEVAIVGAGPAGIAASLRAIEKGLTHITLEQEEIGGTVRHYPKQKLVMTQPVELPLYGKLKRSEYSKEELEAVFAEVLEDYPLRLHTSTRLEAIDRDRDGFTLRTNRGVVRARNVVLALGRRGTPRKLGVPGEELAKVAYRLADAARYQGTRALVVGGGDSAVEAALALSAQPGNEVVLSYRREHFFRLKARNESRLEEAIASGRIEAMLRSEVVEIGPEVVFLKRMSDEEPETVARANDYVFVFAGGVPPYPLLHRIGVQFGGSRPKSTDRVREAARSNG